MEIFTKDINILNRWKDILQDYEIKVVDSIVKSKNGKIVLLDLSSCPKEFFSFIKNNPSSGIDFIVLDSKPDINMANLVLSFGVKAYGNSFMLPVHLISCIETVKSGQIWVYPEFICNLLQNESKKDRSDVLTECSLITEREKEIVSLVLDGLTNMAIAEKLDISLRTVKVHISNIFQKLNVSSRLELMAYFYST